MARRHLEMGDAKRFGAMLLASVLAAACGATTSGSNTPTAALAPAARSTTAPPTARVTPTPTIPPAPDDTPQPIPRLGDGLLVSGTYLIGYTLPARVTVTVGDGWDA